MYIFVDMDSLHSTLKILYDQTTKLMTTTTGKAAGHKKVK